MGRRGGERSGGAEEHGSGKPTRSSLAPPLPCTSAPADVRVASPPRGQGSGLRGRGSGKAGRRTTACSRAAVRPRFVVRGPKRQKKQGVGGGRVAAPPPLGLWQSAGAARAGGVPGGYVRTGEPGSTPGERGARGVESVRVGGRSGRGTPRPNRAAIRNAGRDAALPRLAGGTGGQERPAGWAEWTRDPPPG